MKTGNWKIELFFANFYHYKAHWLYNFLYKFEFFTLVGNDLSGRLTILNITLTWEKMFV